MTIVLWSLLLTIAAGSSIGPIGNSQDDQKAVHQDHAKYGAQFASIGTLKFYQGTTNIFIPFNLSQIWESIEEYETECDLLWEETPEFAAINIARSHVRNQKTIFEDFVKTNFHYSHEFNQREKRGAVNAVGDIMGFLFGTATQQQIDEIHSAVTNSTTMMRGIVKTLNNNTLVINQLVPAVSKLQLFINSSKAIWREQTEAFNEADARLKAVHLQFKSNGVVQMLHELETVLKELLVGELTSRAISLETLDAVLVELQRKGANLVLNGPHRASQYLKLATPTFVPSKSNMNILLFQISLPTKKRAEEYKLFQATTYPIFNETSLVGLKFLLNDGSIYGRSTTMTTFVQMQSLQHCHKINQMYVCPPVEAVFPSNANRCIHNLYIGSDEVPDLCSAYVIPKVTPAFFPTPTGFRYILPESKILLILCAEDAHPKQKTLKGSGIINIPSDAQQTCSLTTRDGITLMTMQSPQEGRVVRPNVQFSIGPKSPTFHEIFTSLSTKQLEWIKSQPPGFSQGPLANLKIPLLEEPSEILWDYNFSMEDLQSKWAITVYAILAVLILSCLMRMCCCIRRCFKIRNGRRARRNEPPLIPSPQPELV